MDKQVFLSKFSDSVYVYNFKPLDKILINDRIFKNFYNNIDGKHKIYEVLYSNADFSVLKENFIRVKESSPNPMLNRPNRKIIQKSNYFVYNNGLFKRLKLRKADLLNLFDKDEKLRLDNYVVSNRLSYKKPKDVDRMLRFNN